jgi:hypothetical protein
MYFFILMLLQLGCTKQRVYHDPGLQCSVSIAELPHQTAGPDPGKTIENNMYVVKACKEVAESRAALIT